MGADFFLWHPLYWYILTYSNEKFSLYSKLSFWHGDRWQTRHFNRSGRIFSWNYERFIRVFEAFWGNDDTIMGHFWACLRMRRRIYEIFLGIFEDWMRSFWGVFKHFRGRDERFCFFSVEHTEEGTIVSRFQDYAALKITRLYAGCYFATMTTWLGFLMGNHDKGFWGTKKCNLLKSNLRRYYPSLAHWS